MDNEVQKVATYMEEIYPDEELRNFVLKYSTITMFYNNNVARGQYSNPSNNT